jgi:hypothetical protein
MDYEKVRKDFMRYNAIKLEELAARYLRFSHLALKEANELESLGRDGDAYLSRENAYFMGLDATDCYNQAKWYRDKLVTPGLDRVE